MTMNGVLNPRTDLDKLYVTQEKGERGSMSVEELVRVEEHCLLDYFNRAVVNSDRVLDAFAKKRRKTVTEQNKMKLVGLQTTRWAASVKNLREKSELLEMVTNRIFYERDKKLAYTAPRGVYSKYGFEPAKHWYEHRAEEVMKNQDVEILWDFNIRTNRVIEARRPDIVLIDRNNQETLINDVVIPVDFHVRTRRLKRY